MSLCFLKKENVNYYLRWLPNGKYLINVILKNEISLPFYVDNYRIIKDSSFEQPYVSGFNDSTNGLYDGRDNGYNSIVTIHYKYDFISVLRIK